MSCFRKMPFQWKISNAWCLRYEQNSASVFKAKYRDFVLTDQRQIIKVSYGEVELKCPADATGIYADFPNGLPRKVRHINCTKKGQTWLYFPDFGNTCQN